MTRAIDPAIISALRADHVRLCYFAEFDFDGGTERLWTGLGQISANDYAGTARTWDGVGSLASIDGLEEGIELSPYALTLGLSRLDSAFANLAINEDYHHRNVRVYVGAFDANLQLVADPGLFFRGELIDMETTLGAPDGEVIVVTCENQLARLDRSANLRYTDTQQQSDYAGDLFFQYLTQVADHRPRWRGKNPTPLGRGGGTGGNDVEYPGLGER